MSPFGVDQGRRWIPILNQGATDIPPYGLVRVTGFDDDTQAFTVEESDVDGLGDVLVNGPNLVAVDEVGQAERADPTIIAYDPDDGAPANGESWGSGSGTWLAKKDQKGFTILGEADGGVVNAVRQGGGGGTIRYLVRCETATPADVTGVGTQCYDATLVVPTATDKIEDLPDDDPVWLTVVGMGGAVVPQAGRYYGVFVITGQVEAVTGDSRRRVFVQEAGGAGDGFWAEITGSSGGAEPGTLYSWKLKVLDPTTHLYVDAAGPITSTNTLKRAPSANTSEVIPNTHVAWCRPSPTAAGFYETGAPEGYVSDVTCNGSGELVVKRG